MHLIPHNALAFTRIQCNEESPNNAYLSKIAAFMQHNDVGCEIAAVCVNARLSAYCNLLIKNSSIGHIALLCYKYGADLTGEDYDGIVYDTQFRIRNNYLHVRLFDNSNGILVLLSEVADFRLNLCDQFAINNVGGRLIDVKDRVSIDKIFRGILAYLIPNYARLGGEIRLLNIESGIRDAIAKCD